MKKKGRKKLPKIKTLKKKAWRLFSAWVIRRDGKVCISCGESNPERHYHCGHYIPKSAGLSIYFCEKNNNVQCAACNVFRHGNLSSYAVALRKKYGPDILEELDAKRKEVKKYTRAGYMDLIEKYKI